MALNAGPTPLILLGSRWVLIGSGWVLIGSGLGSDEKSIAPV